MTGGAYRAQAHGRSCRYGRGTPFRLEPTGDPIFSERLVFPGRLAGWIVLSFSADASASPRRPVLRILRAGGGFELPVLPGPALGRAHWLGLIPDDAIDIQIALAPGTTLDRVGRRSEAGIFAECLLRNPKHAAAALLARLTGQLRRCRDLLRGGLAVSKLRRFREWAADRAVPFTGPVPRLAIRCVVLADGTDDGGLSRTLDSLARQTLRPTEIAVFRDGTTGPTAGEGTWSPAFAAMDLLQTADALCLLRAGDEFDPDALTLLASRLGDADLCYADEIGADGLIRLKPDWSSDLALATGYVGRIALMSRGLLSRMSRFALGHPAEAGIALDIAVAATCRQAIHVPRPLARVAPAWPSPNRQTVLARVAEPTGLAVSMIDRDGIRDLRWPRPEPAPLVSVIIPSRDRPDLIGPACRGVLTETAYPSIELIVVDNGSSDPAVLSFYEALAADARAKILPFPHPFNFAAMVNVGVEAAAGEVVVLLNNDVVVRKPGWLDEMVRQALRPEVGAVGAKLLFGDGRLQHAGVVVGLSGRAGHILRRRPSDAPGHLGRLQVAHEVSAVTAACLAVSREKYRAVGGFDAEAFPIDFNDVDFCLRLGAAGWKCVWTPAAELFHLESVSRGPSVGPKRERFEREAARFTDRWLDVIRHDPFYHPALSLTTFGEDLE